MGTGQRVRGFIEGDTRPNLIIVDDYESELNAATPEARAGLRLRIRVWHQGAMATMSIMPKKEKK